MNYPSLLGQVFDTYLMYKFKARIKLWSFAIRQRNYPNQSVFQNSLNCLPLKDLAIKMTLKGSDVQTYIGCNAKAYV